MVSFASLAQEESVLPDTTTNVEFERPVRPKQNFLFSPRLSITVPTPMGNSSFKKSFVGVYEVNGDFNVMIYKGLYAGLTLKNAKLIITDKKIPNYNASMSINSGALKAGCDFYLGDRNSTIFSVSVASGQNYTSYSSFVSKDGTKHPAFKGFKASYVEPEVNLYFFIEPNFAIGLTATYSVINRNFDPNELYLNEWASFKLKVNMNNLLRRNV